MEMCKRVSFSFGKFKERKLICRLRVCQPHEGRPQGMFEPAFFFSVTLLFGQIKPVSIPSDGKLVIVWTVWTHQVCSLNGISSFEQLMSVNVKTRSVGKRRVCYSRTGQEEKLINL